MPRKQLQQLSQPELIETILQLQARIAKLEAQLKSLTESPKDCPTIPRAWRRSELSRRASKRGSTLLTTLSLPKSWSATCTTSSMFPTSGSRS